MSSGNELFPLSSPPSRTAPLAISVRVCWCECSSGKLLEPRFAQKLLDSKSSSELLSSGCRPAGVATPSSSEKMSNSSVLWAWLPLALTESSRGTASSHVLRWLAVHLEQMSDVQCVHW